MAGWGYDAETSKEYAELRKQGEDLIKQRQYAPAVEVWEKIAALRPVDVLPHTRLAGLYLRKEIHEPDKLIRELKELHFRSLHDNIYAKKISRVYRDEGKTDEAVKFALQAVYIDPYDMDAHELLAQLYEKSGNTAGLEREHRTIPVLATWLEENRKGVIKAK